MNAKTILVVAILVFLGASMPDVFDELKISQFFICAIMLALVFCFQLIQWLFARNQKTSRALKLLGYLTIGCSACAGLFFLFEGPRSVFHLVNLALVVWFFIALRRGMLAVDQMASQTDKKEGP